MRSLEVDVRARVGDLALALTFATNGAPLAIIGPNGAGKTSLLRLILGDLRPRLGRITVGSRLVFDGARGIDVPVEERRIGFVPQRYGLFPHLDVLGNVAYGSPAASKAERATHAREALRELDISALARRRPGEASGGEAQRVALARALVRRPEVLLLDEPLAALDVSVRRGVRAFLAERLRAWALPTVVVTHDREDVEALGGSVLVLERGAIVESGTLAELAASARGEFAREFVGSERRRDAG